MQQIFNRTEVSRLFWLDLKYCLVVYAVVSVENQLARGVRFSLVPIYDNQLAIIPDFVEETRNLFCP